MRRILPLVSSCLVVLSSTLAQAKDWPQWLGENRDGKTTFTPPKTWPKELAQKWKVTVGDGVATPALVGDKLYVFSRQEGGEVLRCLDATNGKELWKSEKFDVLPANGGAANFSGPRSTPTVADGKVVTLGLRGTLTCYDAASGKQLWRKEDFKGSQLRFFASSSPLVTDGLCVAQLGGNENGGVIAYDLATGDEKWKWTGDGPSYASTVMMTVSGTKMVVAETDKKIVGLDLKDGKMLWETPFGVTGGRGYNASTPVVDGNTLMFAGSGRGVTAVKIEKEGDAFVAKELWKNLDNSVQFNTPVLKGGALYGFTANNEFFCINKEGQTAWKAPLSAAATTESPRPESPPANAGPGGPGGGGGRRGGGGGRNGYGSIVDAGSVLLALTAANSELVAFEPSDKSYTEVARIKVSSTPTYAFPVVSGNRIFIKDQNDVMLYAVQ